MKSSPVRAAATLLVTSALLACGDSMGVDDPGTVAVNFQVSTASGAAQTVSGPALVNGPAAVAGPPLVLDGTNGTLTIDEIRLIVAEVELDGEDDACEAEGGGDDCAEVEAPPRFLDLPLDGSPVPAFSGVINPGTYYQLEFEVEDLEDDEEDAEFAAEIASLREEILAEFPDWPEEASALVVGSFESADGETSVSFRVFIEAEIEVERDLVPPLVVTGDEVVPELFVDLRPDIWFGGSDGTVLELQAWDWDSTGEVLELEVEMEEGITEIEMEG
jgi:hypothetical protein